MTRAAVAALPAKKHCNCKNSRCLKLYCECFASGRYCDGCNCVNCCNNKESEQVRQAAVEAILERNPNAFRPKIQVGQPLSSSRVNPHVIRGVAGCKLLHAEPWLLLLFLPYRVQRSAHASPATESILDRMQPSSTTCCQRPS